MDNINRVLEKVKPPPADNFTVDEWIIIHDALVFVRKSVYQEHFEKFMRRNFRGRASAHKTFVDGCVYEGHYLIGMIVQKIKEIEKDERD